VTVSRADIGQVRRSRGYHVLVGVGLVSFGLVHLMLAWLALQIAFGTPAGDGDQSGALRELASKPFGSALVIAIAIGFIAMAIWQAFEAAIGHRNETGARRVLERVASVGRVIVYAYFAWTCFKVDKGAAAGGDQQQQSAADLMTSSGGRLAVGIAGVGLAALGVGLAVYGWREEFKRHLNLGQMPAKLRDKSVLLGKVGYLAKGIAYAIAGVLLALAAYNFDPDKARGLDSALHALAEQPFGTLLLALVALGIAAFSVFCFVQAKYRKV
jgi:Domain of Unknown Function (DUF1206)